MEEHSLYSSQVDWEKIREDSYKQLIYAQDDADINDIIKESLRYLKDGGHSFLMSSSQQASVMTGTSSLPIIESELIEGQVGYLKVPGFVGTPDMAIEFAEKTQGHIERLDQSHLTGWIVDLSENTGGNMWPMLMGLSPLLGDGIYGYFQDNKENRMPWRHRSGEISIGTNPIISLDIPYIIKNTDKKIAVIIGKKTASSGEATLVAFLGMDNARSFGSETAGLSTGNQSFDLKDGSKLYMTTTLFVDRNKNAYGKKIKPDYATLQPKRYALEWITDRKDLKRSKKD